MQTFRLGKEPFNEITFAVTDVATLDQAVIAIAKGVRVFELSGVAMTEEAKTRLERAYSMIGEPEKKLQLCEKENVYWMRRSIAAVRDLPAGSQVQETDILWLRPLAGFYPGEESKVVGSVLKIAISKGAAFTPAHFSGS